MLDGGARVATTLAVDWSPAETKNGIAVATWCPPMNAVVG